jgi:hypothetical protein
MCESQDQLKVLIEEQDARIQDLEQRLLSANARDERVGNSDASLLHKVNTTYTLYHQPEAQGPELQAIDPSLHSLHTNSVPHVAACLCARECMRARLNRFEQQDAVLRSMVDLNSCDSSIYPRLLT